MAGAKQLRHESDRQIRRLSRVVSGAVKGHKSMSPNCLEKLRRVEGRVPVPQTDTGGRQENCKAIGRTSVKEFGKMHP